MGVLGLRPSPPVLSEGPPALSACAPTGRPCLLAPPLDHRSSPASHARVVYSGERRENT